MHRILRWLMVTLALLAGMLLLLGGALYLQGRARLAVVYTVPDDRILVPEGAADLAEGKRIFQYRGCEACHGEQLEGVVYMDNPAIGLVSTPNLTAGAGGVGAERSDADLVRAIRHGVRPDGTALLFMPSTEFYYLSDADLGQVLAYMRSLPPVDHNTSPSVLSATGFVVMNLVENVTFLPAELIPHDAPRPQPPAAGVTPEYGLYLSGSCPVCHGPTFSGGDIPGFPLEWPSAPNLTAGSGSRLPAWGEDGFIEIMGTGAKHGRRMGEDFMPWTSYRHMTADEMRAVYRFLMSLPPKPAGER